MEPRLRRATVINRCPSRYTACRGVFLWLVLRGELLGAGIAAAQAVVN